MSYRSFLLAVGVTVAAASSSFAADWPTKPVKALPPGGDMPFFFVNDNRLTYAYQFSATSPGAAEKTGKQVIAFTHFDVWAYGTNFIDINMVKSDHRDPAAPCFPTVGGSSACAGETEFYGLFRSTFGWNEIFNTKAFSIGPMSNISFEIGADAGTQNSLFGAAKKSWVAGLQFAFDLPYRGYLNIAPLYYKNASHNSYLQTGSGFVPPGFTGLSDGNVNFNGSWALEVNYYMDLGFLPPDLQYFAVSGRAGFYGPGGLGTRGSDTIPTYFDTKMQIYSEPIRLTFDASKLMWGPKYSHFVDVWVAYRYWENKYGLDDSNPANFICFNPNGTNNRTCTEKSLYSGISVKF